MRKHLEHTHGVVENNADQRIRCVKHQGCPIYYYNFRSMKAHINRCRFNPQEHGNQNKFEEVSEEQGLNVDANVYNEPQNHPEEANGEFREPNDINNSAEETFRTMNVLIVTVLGCLVCLKLPKSLTV